MKFDTVLKQLKLNFAMLLLLKGKTKPRLCPSYRLVVAVLVFLALFASSLSQTSMGAAMICMTRDSNHTSNYSEGPSGFDWDKKTQGWVQGARFLTYYLCQLPSGQLTSVMGSKLMVSVGGLAMAALDMLTIPVAGHSLALLIVVRLLQGVANVMVTTGCVSVIGRWAPREESSLLAGTSCLGFYAGASVMFLFGSYACSDTHTDNWAAIFYLSGGMCLGVYTMWTVFASDGPGTSRWAGPEEDAYVAESHKCSAFTGKIPWLSMAKSGPLYALAIGQIGSDWLLGFFITVAPAFFTDTLAMSTATTELVCGVPFLLVLPFTILYGRVLDKLREKKILSTVVARRLSEGIGTLGPVACLMLLTLPSLSDVTAIALYCMCIMSATAVTSGWMANVMDLAPQLSGVVLTVSQTLGIWTFFFVPIFVSYVTANKTVDEWHDVIYISAGLQLVCFTGFCLLSSGEMQDWATSSQGQYHPL